MRRGAAFWSLVCGTAAVAAWYGRGRLRGVPQQPGPTGSATADPRGVIKQARSDLKRGLEDTDCRDIENRKDDHCPR